MAVRYENCIDPNATIFRSLYQISDKQSMEQMKQCEIIIGRNQNDVWQVWSVESAQNIWNGLCPIKERTNIFINQSNDAKCNRKALQLYDIAATVRAQTMSFIC